MNAPADKVDSDQPAPEAVKAPADANPAGNVQAQFELADQTRLAFACGLTIEATIADLTIGAMKMGLEPAEAERLIRDFYGTCASRETPAEAIARCAAMDPMQYDCVREDVAKRHRVRLATLDMKVEAARAKTAGTPATGTGATLIAPDPEPWPDPVEGGRLLDEMTTLLATYISATRAVIDAAALWVLYAHVFVRVELPVAVRLFLTSATKRCGKSRLLRLLAAMAIRPLTVSRMSPAAFYRIAQNLKPVLFLDEADGFIAESPEFKNLINAGFEPEGALVVINVPNGDAWTPAGFYIFTPVALAGIGKLADTTEDRAIKLPMQRQAPGEKKARLRMREVRPRLDEIKRRAMRWATDNATAVAEARPAVSPVLDDRAADFWEMLLAVAAVAGGDWPARATQAGIILSGGRDAGDDSLSIRLLGDIRAVFEASDADRLASKTLCEKLAAIEDAPWSEIRRGKPITQNRLARLLDPLLRPPIGNLQAPLPLALDHDVAVPRA